MLTSTVMRLRAIQNGVLPLAMGEYGHAAFLALLQSVAPDLSQTLHDSGGRQPYTISPLIGGRLKGQQVFVSAGEQYWMRFTMLKPELFAAFTRYFANITTPLHLELHLSHTPFVIEEVVTDPDMDTNSAYITFDELRARASEERFIRLKFMSLTAFSLGEQENGTAIYGVFPEPALVFDSLLRRWNAFASQPLYDPRIWEEWVRNCVVVNDYRTELAKWRFRNHPQVGFVGFCEYQIKGQHSTETKALNTLADFAFYAGVGRKTTQGMGQVRRIVKGSNGQVVNSSSRRVIKPVGHNDQPTA